MNIQPTVKRKLKVLLRKNEKLLAGLRNRIYIPRESRVLYLGRLIGLVGLF